MTECRNCQMMEDETWYYENPEWHFCGWNCLVEWIRDTKAPIDVLVEWAEESVRRGF